jgi:hypothetical protein
MTGQSALRKTQPTEGHETATESTGSSKNSPKSPKQINPPDLSKKRKRSYLQVAPSQSKRLRAHYNDEYRHLYNEAVNEVAYGPSLHGQKLLSPSQIGITTWSSEEKETFFTALAKKGRGDLHAIATAIGSKSEFEVQVYLKLLQNAVVRQHLYHRRSQLFDACAAPAALEVSTACTAALERSAEALCLLQQRAEGKLERKKYHDFWRLNRKIGCWVSASLRRGAGGENEVRERLPAAELLNLEMFVKLSTNIFMNSSTGGQNWREYCYKAEKPSILFTAFADFQTLAVSVTKRLIQSSLFLAMSRIRAASVSNYTPQQVVRREDITAALDVLGMKHNSHMYWSGVAERCGLKVYDEDDGDDGENHFREPLTLPEVRKRLSQGGMKRQDDWFHNNATDDTDGTTATNSGLTSLPSSEDAFSLSDYTSDHSSASTFSTSTGSSSQSPTHRPNAVRLPRQDQDIYAEAIDAKASLEEEKRLWDLLDQKPPKPLIADVIRVPRPPAGERKLGDDLDDWREWIDYAPDWETYPNAIPKASFMRNRRVLGRKGRMRRKKKKLANKVIFKKWRSNERMSKNGDSESESEYEDTSSNETSSKKLNHSEHRENNDDETQGDVDTESEKSSSSDSTEE